MSEKKKGSVADHLRHQLKRILRLESRMDAAEELSARIDELEAAASERDAAAGAGAELEVKVQEMTSRLHQLESENQSLALTCELLREQNGQMANLFAARHRLRAAVDRDDMIRAVTEVVVDLLGAEEFAVFVLESDKSLLRRVAGVGDREDLETVPFPSGLLGMVARGGKPFYYESSTEAGRRGGVPLAALPLKSAGRSVGVIAVYALASHKDGLTPVDHRLLEIVADRLPAVLTPSRLVALDGRRGSRGA